MRKILFLTLGYALSLGAYAEDNHQQADTATVVRNLSADEWLHPIKPSYMDGALVVSPWADNWFVQVAGGTTAFLGTPLGCNDLFGRMKPSFSVSLGKWFTPSVGGRLNYGGMQINDCNNRSQDCQYLRADFMWNVLGGINKEDVHSISRWGIIPYMGVGMLHNKENARKPFAVSYGIQGQYHLSRRVAVTAEIAGMTTMQDFDGYGKAHRFGDHLLSASLGISVHIGKSGWKRIVNARPYIVQNEWLSAYAASLSGQKDFYHALHERDSRALEQLRKILAIEGLLDKYNHLFTDDAGNISVNGYPRNDYSGLKSLRARMKDRNSDGRNGKVVESSTYTQEHGSGTKETDGNYITLVRSGNACIGAPVYFFFELGTDRLLNQSQLVNLDEVARIAKKYGLAVKVVGAADSGTCNEAINNNLSRSRADYIMQELVKRGVASGMVSKQHDGGIDDYSPTEANRHTRIMLYLMP